MFSSKFLLYPAKEIRFTMSQPKEDCYVRFKKQKGDIDREIEEIINQLIQERDEANEKYQKLVEVLKDAFESMENYENVIITSFTPKSEVNSESKMVKCDIVCNKQYVLKHYLFLHMRKHTSQKIYGCSYCSK